LEVRVRLPARIGLHVVPRRPCRQAEHGCAASRMSTALGGAYRRAPDLTARSDGSRWTTIPIPVLRLTPTRRNRSGDIAPDHPCRTRGRLAQYSRRINAGQCFLSHCRQRLNMPARLACPRSDACAIVYADVESDPGGYD